MCRFFTMENKVFSNYPMMVVLAMLLLGGRQAQESSSNNTMLFLAIGSTTRESGYGHVLVPIPLPTLRQTTQTLMDLVDNAVTNKFDTSSPFKQNEMYSITRVQDRINLLMSLAQKDGFVAKEIQRDQVDLLKASLLQLPTSFPSNATPATTVVPRRRTRSATAIAAAFMGLASFGTSIFNSAQMSQLKSDIGQTKDNQKLIIEELREQDLRIHNITEFIDKQFKTWQQQVETSITLTRKQAMDSLEHQVQLLLHSFRFELTDFLQGMMSLMENRLSPLIVSPEALISAFEQLSSNARKRNLLPSSEDPGILFQVPVSTLSDNEGNLYAVVHLPLYSGSTLKLYRHVPAPFFLENTSVILDVESPAEFLALDTHGMVGRQMTSSEFQLCTKVSSIYHCPDMNLLSKNLTTLCLYNLFSQSAANIERTCNVRVKRMHSHAIQISTSLYRIMSTEPTQLVIECETGTNITTIQGIHLLQLTEECPKASTSEYLFVRTPDMIGYHEIIRLPLLSQAKEWLVTIAKEVDLTRDLEEIELDISLSLPEFRQRVGDSTRSLYLRVERYMLSVVLYVVLFGVLVFTVYFILRRGIRIISCCTKSEVSSLPLSLPNAGSMSPRQPDCFSPHFGNETV